METLQSTLKEERTSTPPNSEFPQASKSLSSRLHSRFTSEVDPKWADLVLLGCFFVAGMVDSVVFNKYTCFVSMQTGEQNHAQSNPRKKSSPRPTFENELITRSKIKAIPFS